MPGRLIEHVKCTNNVFKHKALNIIKRKDTLFVANIKGHIPREHLNDCINFLPIIRNKEIITNEETIGSFMYNYMKSNNIKTDIPSRKLTQLAEVTEFTSFSSYYLWYLMDRFHFVIDDINDLLVFDKNTCFSKFTNTFMNERQKAGLEGKKGKDMFCKISLNGSYGYDAMNTAKFNKSRIQNSHRAECSTLSASYRSMRQLGDDCYQVMVQNSFYKCDTCIQEAFFTLDNAKYWYLVFIYDFMNRCLDTERFHFIEGDTDSAYFAVAGDPNLPSTQAFQAIIKDKEFYDNNIYHFAPHYFFCNDESKRPVLTSKIEQKAHEKKLLGLAIEKQGDNMVALCPKCYTSWDNRENVPGTFGPTIALKMKGVSKKQNTHIKPENYLDIINDGITFDGENINLVLKNGQMSRISVSKSALTGTHTKACVLENGVCLPFVEGAKYG